VGRLWLTILGGAFEVAGLGLVAREVGRIQHAEFGTPRFIVRTAAWLSRVLRLKRKHEVAATFSGTADVAGSRMRETAVRILAGTPDAQSPVHYRTRFELFVRQVTHDANQRADPERNLGEWKPAGRSRDEWFARRQEPG
jgi:hypothetical protein